MSSLKSTVILIEKFNIISYFFCILAYRKKTICFVHNGVFGVLFLRFLNFINLSWVQKPQKIEYPDFPGLYIEVKKETGLYVNDAVFDKHKKNVYRKITLDFCKDNRYDIVIKKELYSRYTQKRVKTYLICKYLLTVSENIILLPVDNEPIQNYFSLENRSFSGIIIPQTFGKMNTIIGVIKTISEAIGSPFIYIILCIKICMKGFILRTPEKKYYDFGFDINEHGISWSRPYSEFFLYDRKRFRPSCILHVFREKLLDIKTKNLFTKYKYPFVEYQHQKIPVTYFLNRLVLDLIYGSLKSFLLSIKGWEKNHVLFIPCLAVMKMTIETELFYLFFNIKVFISRDDYSPVHAGTTIVAQSNNNHSIGFMHGDYSLYGEEICTNLLYDKYAIYGNFYRIFHKNGFKFCNPSIIGAGIYGLDKTYDLIQQKYYPAKYKQYQNQLDIVLIMATGFCEDFIVTKEMTIQFYRDALDATKDHKNILRIIKPKGEEFNDPDFQQILSNHPDVIVDVSTWAYRLLAVCELVICINVTTVGLESIIAGKNSLL